MPLFEENPNQQSASTNKQAQTQNTQKSDNQVTSKGWFSLPPALMQLVPWIPLLLEQTTGQKIPQMTGTIAEIQFALSSIQTSQQELITNQQELANRILALETKLSEIQTNATQQFTNLVQQVQTIQSIRLTHSQEKKQIEFNPRPETRSSERMSVVGDQLKDTEENY